MKDKIKITPITYAYSEMSENQIILGGDKNRFYPISFTIYLIVQGDKKILIDVGCEEIEGYVFKNYIPVTEILIEKGVKPEEITDVIITHTHHDHIACIKYFPKAIVHIHKDEFVWAKKYISDFLKVKVFDNNWEISKNIKIEIVGGHSIGSCIVLVEGTDEKYLLCGDEFYTSMCLRRRIPTGNSYNPIKSKAFLEKCLNSDYKMLFFHDDQVIERSFFVE